MKKSFLSGSNAEMVVGWRCAVRAGGGVRCGQVGSMVWLVKKQLRKYRAWRGKNSFKSKTPSCHHLVVDCVPILGTKKNNYFKSSTRV